MDIQQKNTKIIYKPVRCMIDRKTANTGCISRLSLLLAKFTCYFHNVTTKEAPTGPLYNLSLLGLCCHPIPVYRLEPGMERPDKAPFIASA